MVVLFVYASVIVSPVIAVSSSFTVSACAESKGKTIAMNANHMRTARSILFNRLIFIRFLLS